MAAAAPLLAVSPLAAAPPLAASNPDAPDGFSSEKLHGVLKKLIRRGGVAVGSNGKLLFSHGEGRYVPASIIKLVTAMAAFHTLGEDHRFLTRVYRWKNYLYIQGFGDPFLVSEEWRRMAEMLAEKGAFQHPYRRLMLDDTAFAPRQLVDGSTGTLNPYDARLGALVSNFNTVYVRVRGRGRNKTVSSAEPQTPITPIAARLGARMRRGKHRINLTAWKVSGVNYTGELAQAIFERAGGRFSSRAARGRVPAQAKLVLAYRSSKTLRELVRDMLKFSNNFIANQIVMAIALCAEGGTLHAEGRKPRAQGGTTGAEGRKPRAQGGTLRAQGGKTCAGKEKAAQRNLGQDHAVRNPARLKTGVRLLQKFMVRELGISTKRFTLIEGSGISPRNAIGLHAMLAVVDAFHPWKTLLKPFGDPPRAVPAKTGTLTGVYSLAGFLPAPPGERRPFVIILNQRGYTRKKVFEAIWDAFALKPSPSKP